MSRSKFRASAPALAARRPGALRAATSPVMASMAPGAAPPGDGVEEKLVVAIRPRPLSGSTPDAGLRLTPGAVEVAGEGALLFDRVFAAEADNGVVYDDVAAPVVQAVLRGVSGAVLAYGQTGSGKTRTMRGVADDPGLVPRAVRASCAALRRAADSCPAKRGVMHRAAPSAPAPHLRLRCVS
jgi:hypothetical protein